MSFKPNMRVLYPDGVSDQTLRSIKFRDMNKPVWVVTEVLFFDDLSTGSFSGIIAATFVKDGKFHVKTTSGDIIEFREVESNFLMA